MEKKRYHAVRKQRADMRALLRGLVCGYLLYLAWKLARSSDPGFPQYARLLVSGLFAVSACAFGLFTWRRCRAGWREAELTGEEAAELDRERGEEP